MFQAPPPPFPHFLGDSVSLPEVGLVLRATERFRRACAQDPLAEEVVVLPLVAQMARGELPDTVRIHFPDGRLGELTLRSGGVVDADLVDPEQPRCRFRRHRDRRGRFVARR